MLTNPCAQNPWFETVAEAQRRARKRLPPSVYSALVAGSERGTTLDDNVAAFGELAFAPYVAGHHAPSDQATSVLDILRGGVDSALLGTGVASIHDLTPEHVVVPPGFTRELGAATRDS